jgi:hypothetical protein
MVLASLCGAGNPACAGKIACATHFECRGISQPGVELTIVKVVRVFDVNPKECEVIDEPIQFGREVGHGDRFHGLSILIHHGRRGSLGSARVRNFSTGCGVGPAAAAK